MRTLIGKGALFQKQSICEFESHRKHGGYMKRLLFFLLILLILVPSHANPGDIFIDMVERPSERFSNNWTFVIEGSVSLRYEPLQDTRKLLKKSQTAFKYATSFPQDECKFNMFLFAGDYQKEIHVYRDWGPFTPEEVKKTQLWMTNNIGAPHMGIFSHGAKSIGLALRQKLKNLTILIISDGGFTSACDAKGFGLIEKIISDGQKWRLLHGLRQAIICTIGIENKHYYAGGKPSDKDCQNFLKKIGKQQHGGYWYISTEHPKGSK